MRVLIIFALVVHLCHAGLIVEGTVGDNNKPNLQEEHAGQQQQSAQYQQQHQLHQQSSHNNQQHQTNYEHGHNVELGKEPVQQQLHHNQQQHHHNQQQQYQQPPQQYVIIRPQTQTQGVPNHVTMLHDQQRPLLVEPHHQQVSHVEAPESQGPAHNVGVQYVPEHAQYNPQQVHVQHPQVGPQHILLQPVPQYVPQFVQPPTLQQQQPQQTQYVQQQNPLIGVPVVRVGQGVQQQQQPQGEVLQQVPTYTQQSVPNVLTQQQVPQQDVHHIASRPEVSEAEQQQQQYYPQVQAEHQNTYPHKGQQPQIVSHIIVPIAGHHTTALGIYTEATGQQAPGIPVQVIAQHYPHAVMQQGVSYPNTGQFVVNQHSPQRTYTVVPARGVEVATQAQQVDQIMPQQVPQQHVPLAQKPHVEGQYVTQAPHVVLAYNPHQSQGVPLNSDTYVPLESHQYPQAQQPEQQTQHQQLQPISHAPSHSSLSSSLPPSSSHNGSHNGAT